MSIKSIDHLNQVLEELTKNEDWSKINSEVKTKMLNSIHKELAEELLYGEIKKSTKKQTSKGSRRPRKVQQTEDGDDA
ncbi:hypothetical protein HDV00_009897 [Rhizophlyctis rosea]|nr:hypothetical protein HDV00_009897 [Rhizophlyctis rosea]